MSEALEQFAASLASQREWMPEYSPKKISESRIYSRNQEQTIEGVVFTCSECQLPNTEKIIYRGRPDSEEDAIAWVGRINPITHKRGPMCANCVRTYKAQFRDNRFDALTNAARSMGEKGMVFDQNSSTWFRADGCFQTIKAGTNWPKPDAWKMRKR